MRFINPKIEFAFKKIFGSNQSKPILISFLNAMIYDGNPTIADLEIIDPYLASRVQYLKDSYLDVKARLADGATVIIEMQVLNVESFAKRVVYNTAKTYSTQLMRGEGYFKLKPVIALTITDFEMFDNDREVISHFLFKEKERLFEYPDPGMEMIFIELPKFNKQLDELETLTDKWVYFMKNAPSLEVVPSTMENVSEIQQAFAIANETNLNAEELKDLEDRERYIMDQQGILRKGIEEGLAQGREEGREEGIALGMREKALEIARQLLNVLDNQTISQTTGLSVEDIQNLR
ncbi:MAG: Rpn family recombination-promoting nuclease/putative transposase [Oscillatoriales cyanobacterium]|uniref:Rpn family recombination-promoting nuclease/putative transposase n=1 Tax=Microcoleus anatoxicus PTRS2 TaxID=2705321 RepID=A0ABU8YJ36_9CYAN|nr:MAG: Rpn family recombination-promoting nuclease/putative transposase [Oscillatoriales cyanobacterium]TAE02752.1 MAG: Rpn family recombination-promoting nuclease/putative transposase [Oscillatoriales cyanobacterium]TAF00509.1 MAG: Rpn family recombination-promoting nuclease/putative transposase [Oscillatoriales cyanobacterium]